MSMYHDVNTVRTYFDVWRDNLPLKRIEAYNNVILNHSTDSALKTSLSGTFLKYSGVNFVSDKLHVSIEINGVMYPLGIFCVTTETPRRVGGAELVDIEAYSLLYILEQSKIETRRTFGKGTAYLTVIQTLIAETGIVNYAVDDSSLALSTDRADWDIGTSFLDIINELLAEINYDSLWVDHSGTVRATKYTAPDISNVTHTYTEGVNSTISDSYTITSDYFDKANVFIVICDNPELDETMRAESVNDDPNFPYSTVNLGRRVPSITYLNNTPSQDELQKYADNLRAKSRQTNEVIEFVTATDPTHESYDTVLVQVGAVAGIYREIGYEITLSASGQMKHTAERVII